VPPQVRVRDADELVIEANSCPRLLESDTQRPWSVKQRISGRHGHVPNEATRELLVVVASPRWRRIYLTHLSRDCNSRGAVERALADVRSALVACEFAIVEPVLRHELHAGTPRRVSLAPLHEEQPVRWLGYRRARARAWRDGSGLG